MAVCLAAEPPAPPLPPPAPDRGFHHAEQLAAAAFPEGVQAIFEPEWRLPLYKAAAGTGIGHVLTADNYVSLVVHNELTPAFLRAGPILRFSPFAVWDVSLGVYGVWYFDTFTAILPLESADTVASPEWKQEQIDSGQREGGGGIQAYADTRVKFKAGPVLGIAELTVVRNDVYGYRKDLVLYWDPTDQVNAPAHGFVIRRTFYLFADIVHPDSATARRLWIGPALNWTSNELTSDRNIRLGAMLLWKPNDAPAVPTVVLGSQAWLDSRFHDTWPPYTFLAGRWEN